MIFESGMEISDKNICLTGKWIKIMKMRINKMHTRHKRGYKFTDKNSQKEELLHGYCRLYHWGANCSHCLFFSGWRKRKHVSWECGVSSMFVGVIALFNAIVSLREENSYRFFLILRPYALSLLLGWAALYIVGFCCK